MISVRLSAPEVVKSYKDGVSLDCEVPEVVFLEDSEPVNCSVTNSGNTVLSNLKVCKKTQCSTIKLNIAESQELQFPIKVDKPGKYVDGISAIAGNERAETEVEYQVLDRPTVEILNVTLPNTVKFSNKFDLVFTAQQKSYASIPSGRTKVLLDGIEVQDWPFPNLDQPHEYTFSMRGGDLSPGDNILTILVQYPTKDGNVEKKTDLQVTLTDLTVKQTLQVWMNGLARWLGSWF